MLMAAFRSPSEIEEYNKNNFIRRGLVRSIAGRAGDAQRRSFVQARWNERQALRARQQPMSPIRQPGFAIDVDGREYREGQNGRKCKCGFNGEPVVSVRASLGCVHPDLSSFSAIMAVTRLIAHAPQSETAKGYHHPSNMRVFRDAERSQINH